MDKFDIQMDKFSKMLLPIYNEVSKSSIELVMSILDKDDKFEVDSKLVFKYVDGSKLINTKMITKVNELIAQEETIDKAKDKIKKFYNYMDKKYVDLSKEKISKLMGDVLNKEFKKNGLDYRSITNG